MAPASELALLRLAAQRLVGARPATALEAVRWMTALQGQDLPGVLTSTALRTAAATRLGIRDAMDRGEVVRSWPMRGTLHLVAAEDVGWMTALGGPRVATSAARRQAELGLDAATLDRAEDLAVGALSGGRRLTRAALLATWTDGGVSTAGQRAAHLIGHLARTGVICLGPTDGKEQAIVLLDEWVPRPRRLAGDAALAEWSLRYYRSHGPATVADFAWWTGLRLSDARTGLAQVSDRLERLEAAGTTYWMDPATPELLAGCRAEARGVLLLPGFDELLLGYRDRSALLEPGHSELVAPGGNGMFKATVVAGGRVVGTWRRPTRDADPPAVTPFGTLGRGVAAAVASRWRSYPRDV